MPHSQFSYANIANAGFMEELFEQYQRDPNSVETEWRRFFEGIDFAANGSGLGSQSSSKEDQIRRLVDAYRIHGHKMAKINCIATQEPEQAEELKLENLGFSEADLEKSYPTLGFLDTAEAPLLQILEALKATYSGSIGVEYMGLHSVELERYIQDRIEASNFQLPLSIDQKRLILQHLNRSELLEVFLHTKYPGQKRFSVEGGETLLPMMAHMIEAGAEVGMEEFLIGMAHRGRLNVLSNILKKGYKYIFNEFDPAYVPDSVEGAGDVKYHKGFAADVVTQTGKNVHLSLTANPSHLEAVDAVVMGQARAKQVLKGDDEKKRIVPLVIHGDSALSGQGVCYEVMQFQKVNGYSVGGTLHLVINNQIGFTSVPDETRSTRYCTDLAKSFEAPILHVNGEDPEACVRAVLLAVELRQKFGCDVFIDLNCYRKYGHNEGDEPAFTQPLEYQIIRSKKPIREIYRDSLVHQGVVEKAMAEQLEKEFRAQLQASLDEVLEKKPLGAMEAPHSHWDKVKASSHDDLFAPLDTAVDADTLRSLAETFCSVPEGFTIHRKLQRLFKDRLGMLGGAADEAKIDWGMGEALAMATLLNEGHHVRVSGQDSCRGTFNHRHARWTDQKTGEVYFPLANLKEDQGKFHAYSSPLSEYGVLGFEFGYSLSCRGGLIIWEAQFGDFCNGAQIIIDQFISTSEAKWRRMSALTLFLPHAYEGQGPEHSSGRMERFLQLCGKRNMQVVNASTPAQLFHLLRRQTLRLMRKPLIVFTPKGLLRHPKCVSALKDFTEGTFEEVIDDVHQPKNPKKVLFCSGAIYYILRQEMEERGCKDMALIRIEQLYPLATVKLGEMLKKYEGFQEAIWVQEEARNMGAWDYIGPQMEAVLPKGMTMRYVGRPRSASPAAGSMGLHQKEHKALIKELFE